MVQTARGKRKEADATEAQGLDDDEEERAGSSSKEAPGEGDAGALSDSSDEDLPNVRTLKTVLQQRATANAEDEAARPQNSSDELEQGQSSATKRAAADRSDEEEADAEDGGTETNFRRLGLCIVRNGRYNIRRPAGKEAVTPRASCRG